MTRHGQQGALIFITPLLFVVIFFFATLLIDGSRVLSVKSKMQSIVNAAATAAADGAQSCGGATPAFSGMETRALNAANTMGFDSSDGTLQVVPGVLRANVGQNNQLQFFARDPDTQIKQTNATWVSYSRQVPVSSFFPDSIFPSIDLTVDAVARKEVFAVLSATGTTANIQGGLLGNLLGTVTGKPGYSLDVTDLQSTFISLGDLLAALGVEDLTELMNESLVDVLDAVTGLAGGPLTGAGGVVDDLTGAVGISGLDASAVFDVVGTPPGSLDATIPVYDLVTSVLLNSVHAVNQSGSGVLNLMLDTTEEQTLLGSLSSLPVGDLDVSLGLSVNEAPRIVIGPARQDDGGVWLTRVRAADILLEADISVELLPGFIGNLISTLSLGLLDFELLENIDIPLVVQTGGGEAAFIAADCARGDNNTVNFDFGVQDTVAAIETGRLDSGTGVVVSEPVSAQILKLTLNPILLPSISLGNLCLDAELDISLDRMLSDETLDSYSLHCPDGQCSVRRVDEGADSRLQGLDVDVENLALDCGSGGLTGVVSSLAAGLVQPLTDVLDGVTGVVIGGVLSPLLTGLGADLGGIQVSVVGADQMGGRLVEHVIFE